MIQHLLDSGDPEEAENAAYHITIQAYRKMKRDMAMEITEQHVETQSLEAVAELKKGSDNVIRLASMEFRSETTEDIVIFFKLINKMLQIVGKKEEGYKFNPKYILCDEAGGNIRGIKEALGLEFAVARVVTCRWHFMNKISE